METKIKLYEKDSGAILTYLESQPEGLSSLEAKRRLEYFGQNVLPKAKQDSYLKIFARQFQSPLIYLLIVAAILVAMLGQYSDGGIIVLVLVVNAIIGALQEGRANNTLASLEKYITTNATVLRDGTEVIISDSELVPGDVVILREGEKVPADCRILESASLRVLESSITGESEGKDKNAAPILSQKKAPVPIIQQTNMLFLGTFITAGHAKAVVVATGVHTLIGEISEKVLHIKHDIPLERHIKHLTNALILGVFIVSIVLFVIGIWRGVSIADMFGTVVSLAVSIIPEGLPVAVTIILARGVYRMSKRNALVKKLQAVEALGHVDVIAVDKTGTITKNELQVTAVIIGDKEYIFSGDGYSPEGTITYNNRLISPNKHKALLKAGIIFALSSNAQVTKDAKNSAWHVSGDPTDAALLMAAKKVGFIRDELISEYALIEDLPFDYKRKFHASVYKIDGKYFMSAVGAPENILELCEHRDVKQILQKVRTESKKGMRVLAFAYSDNVKPLAQQVVPRLNFGGLVMLQDKLHSNVAVSVATLRAAGIHVVMLTGDNPLTAKSIAEGAGIASTKDVVITGAELAKIKPNDLTTKLLTTNVFARVTPEDKLELINAYSKARLTIAMTGDGVNDAAALVAADLGLAMGKNGTEVAKEAADIVLLDDNFATIVAAVEEGRTIFLTIKKVLLYLLSTSIGELLTISLALACGLPLPLVAAQIIWLNFVTDGFLTVAIGMEGPESDVLKRPFKKPSNYLINANDAWRIFSLGAVMALLSLWIFYHTEGTLIYKQTITLTFLAIVQWFNAWNCRSQKSIFKSRTWSNPYLILATMVVGLLQILAVHWNPLQDILHTSRIRGQDWLMVTGFALLIIVADELYKFTYNLINKPKS